MKVFRAILILILAANFVFAADDDILKFKSKTGKEMQAVFDAEKVKYDKQNRVKKSGLGDAGWTMDGKYLFAFDRGSFRNRTVSLWQVSK